MTTIPELEQHIKDAGSLRATELVQLEIYGCVGDQGRAEAFKARLDAAIAARLAAKKADGE